MRKEVTPATLLRKEIKQSIGNNLNELTFDEFRTYTNQIYSLDDSIMKWKNQERAAFINNIIRGTSQWHEICELRKIENTEEGAKKKAAKLIKLALVEALTLNPYDKDAKGITIKNVEKYVNTKVAAKIELNKLIMSNIALRDNMLAEIVKYMNDEMPIFQWCKKVKGLGPKLTAKLLAGIGDIKRFENPAKLHAYCGIGDANVGQLKKGVQANYSPKMKVLMYLLGEQFIKSKSQYKVIFESRKRKTLKTHPEWHNMMPDGSKNTGKNMHPKHAYIDARRVMVKRFMCELYDSWYRAEGMEPPAKPYGVEIKGHHEEEKIVKI